MTNYIKAPFNFVPLSEKVYYPGWADKVSHDIPFSDGESGVIEIEMEAMTPVFVRNGHTQADANDKTGEYVSFSKNSDGQYFIPATSIKGMIRNVLEIMSFGKMNQISDDRYGFRDLNNQRDYMSKFQAGKVSCGYLRKISNNEIEIVDHGIPYRISHSEIDAKLKSSIANFCTSREDLKSDANRTARKKYQLLGNRNLTFKFNEDSITKRARVDNRRFVNFDNNGKIEGTIVLTGQPGVRKKSFDNKKQKEVWSGKFYEFVFPSEIKGTEILPIQNETDLRFKDFLFIHKDSSDWMNFRKLQFDRGEQVPVFFITDDIGKIVHFGLSYLYKIPYKYRIKDCLYETHKKELPDLADLIFGNQKIGLKGRVQFSHAKLITGELDKIVEPLMGSPKASYYPIYLKQNSSNGVLNDKFYQTYSSNTPSLKGWKRYPVHDKETRLFNIDDKQRKNVSPFIPLKSGSKFSFKLRYHNLKPEEIGSLLASITLNNSGGFHSLGFAKSYGYGKIRLVIKNSRLGSGTSDYMESFKNEIQKKIPNWENSDQIKELLLMSTSNNLDDKLKYMELPEFAAAKSKRQNDGNQLVLPYFSEYVKTYVTINRIHTNKPFQDTSRTVSQVIGKKVIEEQAPIIKPKLEVQPDWIKGTITGLKLVKLDKDNLEVAMVIPREKSNIVIKNGDQVWVKIKQQKKDGSINQVEFIAKTQS